jgi:hypothetical protein
VNNLEKKEGMWVDGDLNEEKGEFVKEGEYKKMKEKEKDNMKLKRFGIV